MAVTEIIAKVFTVVLLGLITGGYIAVAWSPFLLLRQLQPLFRVGQTNKWWLNYLFAAAVIGISHVVVYTVGMLLVGRTEAAVEMIFYSGVGVALFGMVVAGIGLPVLGYNWKRGGYMTEFALLGGAVWYALITIVPPFVLQSLYLARS
ncbi:hypothetical protein [Haladaptatus halobius]|uniref:hypothetical protein n=1 Tax=Haladaptatus halobius TaxID=2884875 RepID=UPI001D0B61F8|nr:hypothetical protein [Haladaptatus halobius]